MGFLSNLFGGGAKAAGDGVKSALDGVGGLAQNIRSAITGDMTNDQKAALETQINDMIKSVDAAQAEINLAEAKSASLFVAGPRPALMWILDIAAFCYFVPRFVIGAVFWTIACIHAGGLVPAPDLGWSDVVTLLGGIVGLGGLRTIEKNLGTQGNH